MYAVIEQGGKQYKVAEGDSLNIELTDVAPDAATIELDKVSENAVVKGKKLYPMHFRRRKSSKRRVGHRQKYLQVTIDEIQT